MARFSAVDSVFHSPDLLGIIAGFAKPFILAATCSELHALVGRVGLIHLNSKWTLIYLEDSKFRDIIQRRIVDVSRQLHLSYCPEEDGDEKPPSLWKPEYQLWIRGVATVSMTVVWKDVACMPWWSFRNTTYLNVGSVYEDDYRLFRCLEFLKYLPLLEDLHVYAYETDLKDLASLQRLKRLTVYTDSCLNSTDALVGLKNLEDIDLGYCCS